MENESKKKYLKSTREGKLYIETKDFFKQEKIVTMIKNLAKSDSLKKIIKANAEGAI